MKQSERKKSYGLLIFSIILLIGSIAWTIYYRDYLSVSKQLSNVKAQKGVLENVIETIDSVQEGQTTVEEGVTKVEKSAENDKLSEELQAMILSVKEEVLDAVFHLCKPYGRDGRLHICTSFTSFVVD